MAEDNPLASEGYILPGGLKAPPDLPPPLPNGLNPHPDLPHPSLFDPAHPGIMYGRDITGPQEPTFDDTPVKPSFDDTQAPMQVLPGGLKPPADIGPPPLANGLAPHPDLPHPDFSEASAPAQHLDLGETPEQKAFDIGAMKRLPPTPETLGAVVDPTAQYAQTVLENAKRQFEGRPEDIWSGFVGPGNLGVVEGPGGIGGPEFAKGLTKALGIEPKEPPAAPAGKAPKYSLKEPPAKTAQLPDASTLSDPFQLKAHRIVTENDAANRPDDAYRNIYQTGAKGPEMKNNGAPREGGATWRDKVVNMLNANASKAPAAPRLGAGLDGGYDPARVGEIQGDSILGFATNSGHVRLLDGSEEPVGNMNGIWGRGGSIIDPSAVTHFKNNAPGAEWVPVKRPVSKAPQPFAAETAPDSAARRSYESIQRAKAENPRLFDEVLAPGEKSLDERIAGRKWDIAQQIGEEYRQEQEAYDDYRRRGIPESALKRPVPLEQRFQMAGLRPKPPEAPPEGPTVIRDKQVPYLAGSSQDGSTVYIDPRVPTALPSLRGGDPATPLSVHERVEHDLMVNQNQPYETAHREALKAEQAQVEKMSGNWTAYQEEMHKLAATTQREKITNPPADLFTENVYPHAEAVRLAEKGGAPRLPPANVPDLGAAPKGVPPSGGGRQPPTKASGEPYSSTREVVADIQRTTQEQTNREKLLSDEGALQARASEVGVSPEELRTLLQNNLNSNRARLADLQRYQSSPGFKQRQESERGSAQNINFKSLEGGGGGRQPPTPPAPPGGTGGPPEPPFKATSLEDSIANAARQNATVHSDFLDNAAQALPSQMSSRRVQEMSNDAFTIKAADEGRREVLIGKTLPALQRKLTGMFGSKRGKLDVQVYHGREADRTLTPEEQAYNEASTVDKVHKENTGLIQELRTYNQPGLEEGLTDPNRPIMHRMRIGKSRGMDEATGIGDVIGYRRGQSFSTRPGTTRERSLFAMEDDQGNIKVVDQREGGHGVNVWRGGKRFAEPGNFIRTEPGKTLPGEEIPGRTTLRRPVVAKVDKEKGLTPAYYKESKQIPDVVRPERTTEPKQFEDKLRPGSEFIDMQNKRWTVRDATTQEIHDAGVRDIMRREIAPGQFRLTYGEKVRFHESALASELMNNLELKKALATAKFNQKWQDSPEFKRYSVLEAEASPEQRSNWVQVPVPGWYGRYYEPRFAEPILDYVKGPGLRIPYFDRVNNFAIASMFKTGIGSIAHGRNIVWQRYLARGWGNTNLLSRAITFNKALDESINKGKIWQDYRDKGASFPSDRLHWDKNPVEMQVLRTLGLRVAKEPGIIAAAKRIGMLPKDFMHALEYGFGKGVFEYGDFVALQHGLELERRGFTREQAIDRMNKVLPTYRLPSRIGTSGTVGRGVTKLLGTRSAVMFGPFEYARFKGLSSVVGDMLKGNLDPSLKASERWDAVGRLAALTVAMTVIGPLLFDKVLQQVTGNKKAHYLFGGSIGMIARMFRTIDDIRSGRKNVVEGLLDMSSVTNWAPFIKEIIQQAWNTDAFTNNPIAPKGSPDNLEIALRAMHGASGLFNPTMLFMDPSRYLVKEPLGISEAKPFDTRPRSMGQARQQMGAQMRAKQKLPNLLQGKLPGFMQGFVKATQ